MVYTLTTNAIDQPYSVTQAPVCYTELVELKDTNGNACGAGSTTCPFISVNTGTGRIEIAANFDTSKLGSYDLIFSKSIQVPSDWT